MVERTAAALTATFHALADPTRRALLERLARGSATMLGLAEPFESSFQAVSKHLGVLESAGLIEREIRGREHHFRLVTDGYSTAAEWIDAQRTFWNSRLDRLEAYLSAEGERKRRPARRKSTSRRRT